MPTHACLPCPCMTQDGTLQALQRRPPHTALGQDTTNTAFSRRMTALPGDALSVWSERACCSFHIRCAHMRNCAFLHSALPLRAAPTPQC